MAVIMTRFCCCQGANLRLGGIVVGILSLIGSSFMLFMTIMSLMWTLQKKSQIDKPNIAQSFSNTTKEHMDDTIHLEYVSLTMDIISLIAAALLIYGTIKRIRPLLYIYIVWTIVIVLGSFVGLFYFALDGPRFIIATYLFHFFFMMATSIYFILVVYSYSELIREGGDRQPVPVQGTAKDAEEHLDLRLQYSRLQKQAEDTEIETNETTGC